MVSFKELIWKAAERNRSRVILALDLEDADPDNLAKRSKEILQKTSKCICAVKINRQLVLSLGLRNGVDSIVKMAHDLSLPTIMDAKLNDVAHTNQFMMRSYVEAGFDAVIASPIAGWEGGLDSAFELAKARGCSLILLVYMSNPGAEAIYSLQAVDGASGSRPLFELLADMAVRWDAQGVIVGATKPEIIARVREIVGPHILILSPGIGPQGGDADKAISTGSDYIIVGRAIYNSPDPMKAAMHYSNLTA